MKIALAAIYHIILKIAVFAVVVLLTATLVQILINLAYVEQL